MNINEWKKIADIAGKDWRTMKLEEIKSISPDGSCESYDPPRTIEIVNTQENK